MCRDPRNSFDNIVFAFYNSCIFCAEAHTQGGSRVSGAGPEVNFLSVKRYSGDKLIPFAGFAAEADCGLFTETCDLKSLCKEVNG